MIATNSLSDGTPLCAQSTRLSPLASPRRGVLLPKLLGAATLAILAAIVLVPIFARSFESVHIKDAEILAAETSYTEALGLKASDPDAARTKFLESAAQFAALTSESDAAGLFFNQGNALLQADRVGSAIAAYLAADKRMPGDRKIRANLAEARAKVLRVTELPSPSALDHMSALWNGINSFSRGALAALLLWTAVFAFLFCGRRITIVAATIGIVLGATVVLDFVRRTRDTTAVLERPAPLRKGNGDGFELVIAEPLPAGTEFRVVETRPGWVEIECSPTVHGWVREDAVLRVP